MKKTNILITTFAILLIVSLIFLSTNNNMTGFVTYEEKNYEEIILNQQFTTTNYLLQNITTINQSINSLLVSGTYFGEGNIKIYLVEGNKEYIVFSKNTNQGGNLITGFSIYEEENETKIEENVEIIIQEELIEENQTPEIELNLTDNISEVLDINLIEEIIQEENNTEIINEIQTFNQTTNEYIVENITEEIIQEENNTPIINETINEEINLTEETNQTIQEQNIYSFQKECLTSCNIKSSNPTLVIELEGNLSVNITSLFFAKEVPITQIQEFNNIVLEKDTILELDLKNYFYSTEKIFFDITTEFNKVQLKKEILSLEAKDFGTYPIQILASTGDNLIRANFNIVVPQELTHSTFIPWENKEIFCLRDCCYKNSFKKIGEIVTENNIQYICSIKEDKTNWIRISQGVFQIKDSNNNLLFNLDNLGNAWLSNSFCQNYNSDLNKFKLNDFILYKNGILNINQIKENQVLTECTSCVKFKDKNNNLLAQVKDETLELKGTFYSTQKSSTSCQN